MNGWPQAGQTAALSLRLSLRDGVWAGGRRGGAGLTGLLLLSCCRGDAAQVTVLEPVGVALERDYLGVVDEPVDHRGGDDVVAEHLAPPAERLVAGHDQARSLVPGRDQLEEQVGGLGLERDVADFVNLCRARHKSTYADPGTMPRLVQRDVNAVALGFGIGIAGDGWVGIVP